jgi:hypothetical protein
VQVSGTAGERRHKSKKVALSPEVIEEFDALSKRVGDDGLKNALARLVQHHGGRKTR